MSIENHQSTDIGAQCDAILERIKLLLTRNLDEAAQVEVAKLVTCLHYAKKSKNHDCIAVLEVAVDAISQSPPAMKLASELFIEVDKNSPGSRSRFLIRALRLRSPATAVVLGMGVVLYFAIPISFIFLPRLMANPETLAMDVRLLAIVGIAGAIGSVVSIMVRIADFSKSPVIDRSVLFLTGAFKPIIGCAFAMFAFAAIKSKLIPLATEPSTEPYLAIALAFVSGFSERFAPDVVTAAEGTIIKVTNATVSNSHNHTQ